MVAWLVLIGVLLAPSAAFLLWSWRSSRSDMALMRATETTRAADVAKLPAGSLVEVKGRLRCAAPVTGELSNSPCAHFVSTVERDYEFFEYDSHRKTACRKRKTEIIKSTTLFTPFEIEDASGRVRVSPEQASIEGIEAVAREDVRRHMAEGESVMQTALGTINNTNRTLCFRYKETHLPVDVDVYVLGVVGEDRSICAPPDGAKGQRFLISVNSEEARAAELGSKSRVMLSIGMVCLLGAVVSLASAAYLARNGLDRPAPPQDVLQNESWW
jgi:hypothetical protein